MIFVWSNDDSQVLLIHNRRSAPSVVPKARVAPQVKTEKEENVEMSDTQIDNKAVREFVSGNTKAFDTIVERHREKIYSVCFGLLKNHSDAQEVTNDTFVRAFRSLAKFRGDSSLKTWLYRVALNLSRNRYWYNYRRRRHCTMSLDAPLSAEYEHTFNDMVATDAPTPPRILAMQEFSVIVSRCLENLAPRHRQILTMRGCLYKTYEEIARALGIEVGTVKSRIARARINLIENIRASCPEFADVDPNSWLEKTTLHGIMHAEPGVR